jgi:gas vesicle protein
MTTTYSIDYQEKINDINETFLASLPKFKQSFILYYKNIESDNITYKNNYESIQFFIESKINEMKQTNYDIKNSIQCQINSFSNINSKLSKEKQYYDITKNKLDKIKNAVSKSTESVENAKDIYKSAYIVYAELLIGILLIIALEYNLFRKNTT